jgi:hypothetical protein
MTKYTKIEQMVHEMFALRQSYSLDRFDEQAVKNEIFVRISAQTSKKRPNQISKDTLLY